MQMNSSWCFPLERSRLFYSSSSKACNLKSGNRNWLVAEGQLRHSFPCHLLTDRTRTIRPIRQHPTDDLLSKLLLLPPLFNSFDISRVLLTTESMVLTVIFWRPPSPPKTSCPRPSNGRYCSSWWSCFWCWLLLILLALHIFRKRKMGVFFFVFYFLAG